MVKIVKQFCKKCRNLDQWDSILYEQKQKFKNKTFTSHVILYIRKSLKFLSPRILLNIKQPSLSHISKGSINTGIGIILRRL